MKGLIAAASVIILLLVVTFVWAMIQLPKTMLQSLDNQTKIQSDRYHEVQMQLDTDRHDIDTIQKILVDMKAAQTDLHDVMTSHQKALAWQGRRLEHLDSGYTTDHDWILSQKFGDKAAKEAQEAQQIIQERTKRLHAIDPLPHQ